MHTRKQPAKIQSPVDSLNQYHYLGRAIHGPLATQHDWVITQFHVSSLHVASIKPLFANSTQSVVIVPMGPDMKETYDVRTRLKGITPIGVTPFHSSFGKL